jgi:hypothetical protein
MATNPIGTASMLFGFDVMEMLRPNDPQPVEWTTSSDDLYNPGSGYFDIEDTFNDPHVVGNISTPLGFDYVFRDSIRDGYIIPAGKLKHSLRKIMANACSPRRPYSPASKLNRQVRGMALVTTTVPSSTVKVETGGHSTTAGSDTTVVFCFLRLGEHAEVSVSDSLLEECLA